MAGITQIGAIYAIGSRLLQRIYIPSVDDGEIDQQYVGPGEAMMRLSLATYREFGPIAIQAAIGAPTFSGRCAVVDEATSKVVDVILADPALFVDPRGLVIAHDVAIHGDTLTVARAGARNVQMFQRRYVEINPRAPSVMSSVVAESMWDVEAVPQPVTAGNIMMASDTMKVGQPIPPAVYQNLKAKFP